MSAATEWWTGVSLALVGSPGLREVLLLLARGSVVVALAWVCDGAAARWGSGALRRGIWAATSSLLLALGLVAVAAVAHADAGQAELGAGMTWQSASGSQGPGYGWVPPLWLGAASAVTVAYLVGLARAMWVFRQGRPVSDPGLQARLEDAARQVGVEAPEARVTGAVSVPVAVGVWRGRLLLPAAHSDLITRDVLAHELVHLKHRDLAARAVMRMALALSWFNPLAWAARRRLRTTSEYACDDHVARLGDVAGYARALVAWMDRPGPVVDGLALGRSGGGELIRRLERLSRSPATSMGTWTGRAVVLAAAFVGVAVMAGIRPPTPDLQFIPAPVPAAPSAPQLPIPLQDASTRL